MLNLLIKYGVAVHVAIMVVYASWARGGSVPYYFWAFPWLALGLIEIMVLMPITHGNESLHDALNRFWRGILRDPVTYIGIALLAFLTLQWMNGPRELVENTLNGVWEYADAPWPSLPFCVVRDEALQVLLWFIAVVVSVLAVRHSMKPNAKYFLLKCIVANGALLSLLGILQLVTCPGKLFWCRPLDVYFFSTFGYPNHAGEFFVLTTAINMGLMIRALGDRENSIGQGWMSVAFIFNAVGIYCSLCRASIILGTIVLFLGFVYGLAYLYNRISKSKIIVSGCTVLVLAAGIAIFAVIPNSQFSKELKSIDFAKLSSVYEGDRKDLAEAALNIWKDYPWTGVGGWGFKRYVGLYIPEEKWDFLRSAGRANVHNDPLQFLCEHGAIGAGLITAFIITLLVHVVYRLSHAQRELNIATEKQMNWFSSISPVVWSILAGTFAILVHSTVDLPFRSVAVTLVWVISLACIPGLISINKTVHAESSDVHHQHHSGTGNDKQHSNGTHHHHHHSSEIASDHNSTAAHVHHHHHSSEIASDHNSTAAHVHHHLK